MMIALGMITLSAMAVPAKRGIWKTLTLADGTEVKAQLVGDEHGHFWVSEDGKAYAAKGDAKIYKQVEKKTIIERAKARRAKANAKRVQKRQFGHPTTILGQKKAIMLLVNFKDTKFNTAHDNALYQRIANEENFSEGKFKGSIADYFKAQSRGKFELDFDVVGPLTLSKDASYYGQNNSEGNDMHAGEMVCDAVKLAKEQISDWKPYDWDNDGYVDQVYVVYAGKGEADGGAEETIWPHAYDLDQAQYFDGDGDGPVTVGTNLVVNSYACGSELQGYTGEIAGIGTMCHEYSHCLGYPDFYDIDYSGGQGMGAWDLMDAGSYNDDGYQPAGYTSYERWFAGWEEPIELKAEDVEVRNMKSLQAGGESYIIYNDKNANEYYLLENRQFEGWDASAPYNGLLIIHCDYDASVWEQNAPNDDPNHQRFTVVPADGKYTYETYQGTKYYDDAETFPYKTVNSFNKNFKTSEKQAKNAAQFFKKTSNGTYWMNGSVEEITQNADGTISFNYVAEFNTGNNDDTTTVNIDGALFYESFDQCDGTGGNDDNWSGTIANATFTPDNEGWTACEDDKGEKAYGANQCARFGSSSVVGFATTPSFTLNGTTTLKFNAGAWNSSKDGTTLSITAEGGTVSPTSVTLSKGEFNEYTATLTANGSVNLTFAMDKGRFFLDEVVVVDKDVLTGISTTPAASAKQNRIYTLDGRYTGTDFSTLKHGLYIINGKKVVK